MKQGTRATLESMFGLDGKLLSYEQEYGSLSLEALFSLLFVARRPPTS